MTRKYLLIGISTAALAAGVASAQSNNIATENCSSTSGANNTCDVNNNFSGNTDNTGTINQRGGGGNVAFITQVGDENRSTIDQNGDNNGARNTQNGDDHVHTTNQTGFENFSSVDQGDDENSATVNQTTTNGTRGAASGSTTQFDNQSFIAQGTSFQNGGGSAATGTAGETPGATPTSSSQVTPGTPSSTQGFAGENNTVSVSQNGTNLFSSVLQAANQNGTTSTTDVLNADGTTTTTSTTTGVTGVSADFNSATVTQSGIGSSSSLSQRSNRNTARVFMADGGRNTDAAVGSTTSNQQRNTSVITQSNSTVVQTGTDSSGNGTFTGGGFNSDGTPTPGQSNPNVGSNADVAITGQGNSSTVSQDGVLNNVRVSLLNGGGGQVQTGATGFGGEAITAGRRQGNSTSISQTGINHNVRVGSGGRINNFGGAGSVSTITQGGATAGPNGTAGNIGRNHSATVFQSGTLDTVTINQQNNSGINTVSGTGFQNGSVADVAQRTLNSSASVTQFGTNFARLTQGGGDSGNNSATIAQTDAGDRQGETTNNTGGDIFTQPTTSTGPNTLARNTALFSQSGVTNSGTINQNAINASATVFQRLNSRSNLAQINQGVADANNNGSFAGNIDLSARIEQTGRGASDANGVSSPAGSSSSATITQGGRNQSATITQTGNRVDQNVPNNSLNTASITQQTAANTSGTSTNNLASITQVGFTLSATVTQNGSGSADSTSTGGRDLRNRITVSQTGDRHTATATQESTVRASSSNSPGGAPASGPTGAEFARGSGTQSAEIQIFQSGSRTSSADATPGNSATVTQQGEGQFARIDQRGRQNTAGILQTNTATNAVAVIEQFGSNNQFFITQTQAGQFFRVQQNGNNNANTTQLSSGPGGGGQTSTGSQATQPTPGTTTP